MYTRLCQFATGRFDNRVVMHLPIRWKRSQENKISSLPLSFLVRDESGKMLSLFKSHELASAG